MNFSMFKRSDVYYSGSERKLGIIIGEDEYMVKFQKATAFGKRYNHVSEYLVNTSFLLMMLEKAL